MLGPLVKLYRPSKCQKCEQPVTVFPVVRLGLRAVRLTDSQKADCYLCAKCVAKEVCPS